MSTIDGSHANMGHLLGYPVYASAEATRPLVLRHPETHQIMIIVPSYREFENEIWIEQALHRAVRENMGDTLEWLYGPGSRNSWVAPSSRYSRLLMRLERERTRDDTIQTLRAAGRKFSEIFAPITRSASRTVDGPSIALRAYGSMVTPPADVRSTIINS